MRLPSLPSIPRFASVVFAAALISACGGGGLSGTYKFADSMVNTTITFKSGGKVEVTTMGTTQEGTWVMDGKRVKITIGGATQILPIDDKGCLDWGEIMGKGCKTDK